MLQLPLCHRKITRPLLGIIPVDAEADLGQHSASIHHGYNYLP